MKPRHRADALEDDGLGVVEQPLAGHAAERAGGSHERPAQRVDGQVDDELAPHRARVSEHHHEQPQRATRRYSDLAGVGPVDLATSPVAFQSRGRLARGWVDGRHARERWDRATKPARADHVVQPRGAQLRIPLQGVVDEWAIRVDGAGAAPRVDAARRDEHPSDLVTWVSSCVTIVPTGQCSA